MPTFTEKLLVQKPALLGDGWDGGLRINYIADFIGGTHGTVNSPNTTYTVVGKNTRNFIYNSLNVLHNFSDFGENVAGYDKGIKSGAGPTWGRCIEVNDAHNNPGPMIGVEVDVFCSGAATPERPRVGVDALVGDEPAKQGQAATGAQATYGFRAAATTVTPWARWLTAFLATDYKDAGLQLVGKGSVRGIEFFGDHVVGLDFSRGDFQTIMRVREGQEYSLDSFDQVKFRRHGDRIQFLNCPNVTTKNVVAEIGLDGSLYLYGTGAIFRNGVRVL